MKQVEYYSASIELASGPHTAHSLQIVYSATSWRDAIESAYRFAKNRERYLGWTVTAISVYGCAPHPITLDGDFIPEIIGPTFEWKYDRPGTFEDYPGKNQLNV